MAQFTVYRNPDNAGYLLNVQADVNDHFGDTCGGSAVPCR